MHSIEKHSIHHHYNPFKNDPYVFEYMYPPEHGEYQWITNPHFTNQHSISQFISKLHIQHFNNTKIIHQISSSQELPTSQNNKSIHKLYKQKEKLTQDSQSTYKKLPTENGEQISQYGEHMKQWDDTINNIFPNKKISLKQWNPTFHVLNTNITCIKSSNIPVKENKSHNTYQVMGRQNQSHKTLYKIIFKKNLFKNLQTYYILKTLWYISWICG